MMENFLCLLIFLNFIYGSQVFLLSMFLFPRRALLILSDCSFNTRDIARGSLLKFFFTVSNYVLPRFVKIFKQKSSKSLFHGQEQFRPFGAGGYASN